MKVALTDGLARLRQLCGKMPLYIISVTVEVVLWGPLTSVFCGGID